MRTIRQVHAALVMFAFLVVVTGCAALGLVTPESFREKLATGFATVEAVNTSTLALLKAKKISPDDAENINKQSDNANEALKIARVVSDTDQAAANAKLTATITALSALQAYLATKEGAK